MQTEKPGAMFKIDDLDDIALKLAATKTKDEAIDVLTENLEAVILSFAAKAGPIPFLLAKVSAGAVIEPLVSALVTLYRHIGMSIPEGIESLVERLETVVKIDLDGDGYIGPEPYEALADDDAD